MLSVVTDTQELNIHDIKVNKTIINELPKRLKFYYKSSTLSSQRLFEVKVLALFSPLVSIGITIVFLILALIIVIIMYVLGTIICFVITRIGYTSNTARVWLRESGARLNKLFANTSEFVYSTQNEKYIHNLCVICLVEFRPGCKLRRLACSHIFHKDCVDPWVQSKILHIPRCPICNLALIDEKPPANLYLNMEEITTTEMSFIGNE